MPRQTYRKGRSKNVMSPKTKKIRLVFGDHDMKYLELLAEERGVKVQDLVKDVIMTKVLEGTFVSWLHSIGDHDD